MMKLTAAALALCSSMAFACPGTACSTTDTAKTASASTASVQTVAYGPKGECPLGCDGAKAEAQAVAAPAKGECPMGCEGAKGAPADAQSVAFNAPEGVTCDKSACTGDAMDCAASGACNKPCKLSCQAPAMTFKVGDETTTCPETAKTMASEHHAQVHYVVAGAEYADETQARAAHLSAMNQYLDSLTHVSYSVAGEHMECPMSAAAACEKSGQAMQYQVGPMVFDNADEAIRAAALARAALQQVAMTYEVEGKPTECSTEAKSMAASCASKSMTFVVNGQKTQCEETAKYMLTQAQVAAAVGAIQKMMS